MDVGKWQVDDGVTTTVSPWGQSSGRGVEGRAQCRKDAGTQTCMARLLCRGYLGLGRLVVLSNSPSPPLGVILFFALALHLPSGLFFFLATSFRHLVFRVLSLFSLYLIMVDLRSSQVAFRQCMLSFSLFDLGHFSTYSAPSMLSAITSCPSLFAACLVFLSCLHVLSSRMQCMSLVLGMPCPGARGAADVIGRQRDPERPKEARKKKRGSGPRLAR